jgi:hypothetical protein
MQRTRPSRVFDPDLPGSSTPTSGRGLEGVPKGKTGGGGSADPNRICAFDIGVKNFAFAVWQRQSGYVLLQNTSMCSTKTKTDLNKLKKQDLLLMMQSLSLIAPENPTKANLVDTITKRTSKKKKLDIATQLINLMDIWLPQISNCDLFLIEKQMRVNKTALKVSHYLEIYLRLRVPDAKTIVYSASCKTKKLAAPPLLTKHARKKWTTDFAKTLLFGDQLLAFENLSKQDDVADTICMIESYICPRTKK